MNYSPFKIKQAFEKIALNKAETVALKKAIKKFMPERKDYVLAGGGGVLKKGKGKEFETVLKSKPKKMNAAAIKDVEKYDPKSIREAVNEVGGRKELVRNVGESNPFVSIGYSSPTQRKAFIGSGKIPYHKKLSPDDPQQKAILDIGEGLPGVVGHEMGHMKDIDDIKSLSKKVYKNTGNKSFKDIKFGKYRSERVADRSAKKFERLYKKELDKMGLRSRFKKQPELKKARKTEAEEVAKLYSN